LDHYEIQHDRGEALVGFAKHTAPTNVANSCVTTPVWAV
jgi:hypothetical protein